MTRLIVADPRRIELTEHAELHLRHKSGSDVALINAMVRVILTEGLEDKVFIAERTEGIEEVRQAVEPYTPEMAAKITGVAAEDIARTCHGHPTLNEAVKEAALAVAGRRRAVAVGEVQGVVDVDERGLVYIVDRYTGFDVLEFSAPG